MAQLHNAIGIKGIFTDGDWILSDNMDKAGTIGVIQLKHVGVGEFLRKDFQFISEKTFRDLGCTEVLPGDVLISRMADPIARACIVPRLPFRLVTAVDVSILRVDEQTADRSFISHLCNSPVVRNQAETAGRGTTRSRITRTELESLEIPLPELSEQKRIATLLEQADRLRRTRRYALELSDTFLPAAFLELFGDPACSPHGFQKVQVEELFAKDRDGTKCGPFGSALKKHEYQSHGIPVWTMNNFSGGDFREEGCLYVSEEKYRELAAYSVKDGDILISRAGTVGRMAIVKTKCERSIIHTNLIRLSLDATRLSPIFFITLMKSFGSCIARLRRGQEDAYSFMSTGSLGELRIPLPPMTLQQRFCDLFARHEQLRSRQGEALRQADHLFQSLLHRAFSEGG